MNKEKIDILIRMLQTHVSKEAEEKHDKNVIKKSIHVSPFTDDEINKIKDMIFKEIDRE